MKKTNHPGIYRIRNIINDKVYIGQSISIRDRWNSHKGALRKNDHRNHYLQNAWNKYGEDNFAFEVIEDFSYLADIELDDALSKSEIDWIIKYRGNSYNLMIATQHGMRASPELKEWFRGFHKGMLDDQDMRIRKIASITASYDKHDLRARRSVTSKAYANLPSTKARVSQHFIDFWQDPTHQANQSARMLALWQDESYCENQYNSRVAVWKIPEVYERRVAGLTEAANRPEVKAKRKASALVTWAAKRERGETKWSEERKAKHRERLQNPETKAKRSAAQKLSHAKRRATKLAREGFSPSS